MADADGDVRTTDLRLLASGQETPFLESLDVLRLDASRRLTPERRAELGQFLTPLPVARLMASMFGELGGSVRLLDAGAGTGSLLAAFLEESCRRTPRPARLAITAYELDEELAGYLRSALGSCETRAASLGVEFTSDLRHEDFIRAGIEAVQGGLFEGRGRPEFDCAILNPPYRKLATASEEHGLLESVGVEATNLYTAFLALVVRMLRPGGELVAITPRSFCNGPYFRQFRREFLRSMSLRKVHVFESRSRAFRDDEVLQENIIFHAVKGAPPPRTVTVSSSEGPEDEALATRDVPYAQVVRPGDKDAFIRLVTDDLQEGVADRIGALQSSLTDLGISVSTGRVVDFRAKEHLRPGPGRGAAPLVYPCHLTQGAVRWPSEAGRKPNALHVTFATEGLLVPSEVYVLVKRFTAKEERKRVVAAVFEPGAVEGDRVGFENHLNYFHRQGRGLPLPVARGLAAFLNSTLVDAYFRQFNGHTQVNATDLRSLRYPALTWHIPDPGCHQVRYYGAYANRSRALYRAAGEGTSPKPGAGTATEPKSKSRASWARLIGRVFECDPLTCPRCGARMRIVAFLTEHRVIDEILRHLEAHPSEDLFHARDPPAA
jgi:adenine-specific DNA-methyltransferase